jgi:hypothetical protein
MVHASAMENPEIFVRDIPINLTFDFDSYIYNAFMVSPPNNPIFKACIEDIVHNCSLKLYKTGALDITGPGCLIKFIKVHKEEKYVDSLLFYNSTRNIIEFLRTQNVIIYYKNIAIIESYNEYRSEQKLFQKSPHYSELWLKRDIYN